MIINSNFTFFAIAIKIKDIAIVFIYIFGYKYPLFEFSLLTDEVENCSHIGELNLIAPKRLQSSFEIGIDAIDSLSFITE